MTTKPHAPAGWIEAIERGEGDLIAARVLPCDNIEHERRRAMARVSAKQRQAPATPAKPVLGA